MLHNENLNRRHHGTIPVKYACSFSLNAKTKCINHICNKEASWLSAQLLQPSGFTEFTEYIRSDYMQLVMCQKVVVNVMVCGGMSCLVVVSVIQGLGPV